MKRAGSMLAAAVLVLVFTGTLAAQERSDFEVVRSFERESKELQKLIDSARTVQDCADISVTIDHMHEVYAIDRELLDKSLYGENFEERITRLRVHLRLNQDKLGVIESQVSRIADLETQVRALSSQVERLSEDNTQLMADIERMSANVKGLSAAGMATNTMIDSLKGVIGKLQQGLRERDELIFALVDSMFMQYDKEIAQMGDSEKRGLVMKLDRNNVVQGIKSSIESNLRFLSRTELKGTDLASVLSEQNKFEAQWRGLGPKLTSLYVNNKNRAKELAAVDTLLKAWSARAVEAYWRGLNAAFTSRQIAVSQFMNGSEFAANLTAYIDSQMVVERPGDENKRTFESFQSAWIEEVRAAWMPLMVSRGDLTPEQQRTLEEKVESWKSSVTPTSPVTYLFIFIAIVAILAVAYTQLKRRPLPPTS